MPKDPKYQANAAKFFGVEQNGRRELPYAERLKKFINN